MTPKYGNIQVRLVGEDGNAFAIMSRVTSALRKGGVSEDEVQQYIAESMSGDYDALLRTAQMWVAVS